MESEERAWSQELREAVSEPRFGTFLTHGRIVQTAWMLYEWNLAVSASLFTPLAVLEVTLRNRLNRAARHRFGTGWILDPDVLGPDDRRPIERAALSLERRGSRPSPDAMVSELPLGFWVGLLANRHDQDLWRQALHRAFQPGTPRRIVHEQLQRIRVLRNRIAHHEHLLLRDLAADVDVIEHVLGMLSPVAARWALEMSDVRSVVAQRPVPFGS